MGEGVKVQPRLLAYNPRRMEVERRGEGGAGSRDIKSMMRLLVEV